MLRNERVIVLIQLLEFVNEDDIINEYELEFTKTAAKTFNISDNEFENFKSFVSHDSPEYLEKDKVLLIDNQLRDWSENLAWMMKKKSSKQGIDYKYLYRKNLYGKIIVLFIQSTNSFVFKYFGELNLFLEGHKINSGKSYFINKGSIIKGPNIESIYYHDIAGIFIAEKQKHQIIFTASEIEYHFKNTVNGIQKFSFSEESGQLIGIMGGSGVGKSTLLNLLSGKLPTHHGKIKINNINIHSNLDSLTGIIGYVPQDDLLFEELTVFQNLYYNAKLCFSEYTEEQIVNKVNNVLIDLDLYENRNLQVGNPLNKRISGGQRKRLNIGLELMREPMLLFVDEPTSGLSSMDSEKVMNLLKEQTLNGKLVIVNIHQPSSDVFKLFDKLWILDKGGYPIYQGNPVDSIVYFKTSSSQVNAAESECALCGNVKAEQILRIIEAKEIDDFGKETNIRIITPEQWYERYQQNIENKITPKHEDENLPETEFRIPNLLKQFRVFITRNILSKLTNRQYLLINLLEAPLLAVILGYLTKYVASNDYIFSENKNLPVYLFMAVVVSLFLGLTVSAEEIIKDRKILERELFLQLSWFSYINSKVLYLFCLSALQAFLYVIIGNAILEIKGMLFPYWLILFATSCMGNMVGLNISSGLNSVGTIYILIPLILVPQLLLGGAMIRYDDLHKSLTSRIYVPFISSIMTTRWAYEALSVEQFKNNKFEKLFYPEDQIISSIDYKNAYVIPHLNNKIDLSLRRTSLQTDSNIVVRDLRIVTNEMKYLISNTDLPPFEFIEYLNISDFNNEIAEEATNYLNFIKMLLAEQGSIANKNKDAIYKELINEIGGENFMIFKQDNYNKKLADIVLNRNEINKVFQTDTRLIQKKDPVFMMPTSNSGRSHFFAPVKIIFGFKIDTLWYNCLMMLLGCSILYFTLYFDILRKIINYFEKINLRKLYAGMNK